LIQVVERAVTDVRSAVQHSGVVIELNAGPERIYANGDETRLAQVIGNLLYNAVKFSHRGGTVTVRVRATSKGDAAISITDQGVGMGPATLSTVFEPYAQGEATGARRRAGLGLGLTLVKGLVELHGGRIVAHSAGTGHGATFTVTLPIDRSPAPEAPAPREAEVPSTRRCRVVVIDDRRDAAHTLRRMLELSGHDASVAEDGPRGVELVRKLQPDLVLCDLDLPGGMSGLDVARELRGGSATAHITLVAVTGHGDDDAREQALAAGFDRHEMKPLSLLVLQRILSALPCTVSSPADSTP
jgi:CheY-like chemotaxis protein